MMKLSVKDDVYYMKKFGIYTLDTVRTWYPTGFVITYRRGGLYSVRDGDVVFYSLFDKVHVYR